MKRIRARKTIFQLKKDILKNENELESLRIRYRSRVLKSYKKGNLSDLEKVFSSTTWRQAIYRSQYLKLISKIEKKLTKNIEKLLVDISRQKVELEVALRDNLNLKRDKQTQITSYRNMRINREKELNRIRNDKNALTSYVSEKEEGIEQLEKIIKRVLEDKARFERELRIRQQQETLKTKSFKALKGQLPWPAEGRIISKFGRQWNPKLKTTTENPGIDIKGKPGSSIRTVLGGVVTTITYIRGYGTTIIVDHGGGFYTVYSHVTNIQTNVDSQVRNGDVIAYMGDSGSINGSKLHFEIWGKGQKLDPERWLRKKINSSGIRQSQKVVWEQLQKITVSSRLGNAYLFHGPPGNGKEYIATKFAQMLNCEKEKVPFAENAHHVKGLRFFNMKI